MSMSIYALLAGIRRKQGLTDEVKLAWKKLKHPKGCCLGEIGLDYHWMTAPKEVQEQVFRRQIQLSKIWICLFVVHTVMLEDTYEIIKSEGVGPRGGIMHSFSGSLEWAGEVVELGMTISSQVWWPLKSDGYPRGC